MASGLSVNAMLLRAQAMTERDDPQLAGVWPRAGAVLARQALETSLKVLWGRVDPPMRTASMRAQLICLEQALPDRELARDVDYAWWSLTSACHHRAYELGPTAEELRAHIATVRRLAHAVAQRIA